MKRWLLVLLAIFTIPSALAGTFPFTVKANQHPRVYIDPARVDVIRTATAQPIPLNGAAFPQNTGTLIFDIKPVPKTDATQSTYLPVFDNWDSSRSHIFVRHSDAAETWSNPVGSTSCNSDPNDQVNLCFQVGLQIKGLNVPWYIGGSNFQLKANQWQRVKITWNSVNHTASLQIDSAAPVQMPWHKTNNTYDEWTPSEQKFTFSGRDGIDNIRLYNSDTSAANSLLVEYLMNGMTNSIISDTSINSHNAIVSSGVSLAARSAIDPDLAIYMDGNTGVLNVVPDSMLKPAWADFYSNAVNVALQLNSGSSPANVSTGHPNSIEDVARNIGLAYLVTGEAQFSSAALKYADSLLAVTPRDTGGDYTQAGRVEAMGVLYDWFFNFLHDPSTPIHSSGLSYPDALATAIKETIKAYDKYSETAICGYNNPITLAVDGSWTCSTLPANPDFISGHSHQNNTEITAGMLAIVDQHPELESLLNIEYQNFVNGYNPARAWISVDGGHHMGWDYGAGYTFLDSIQLWDTATIGISMNDAWQGKLGDRYIYGLRGDMVYPASGDAFTGTGVTPQSEWVIAFALRGSKYFGNTYAQNFYNRWIAPSKKGARFNELLYWEPNLAESPIEQLDYSRLFSNAGQVVMRDTWDYPNAALLEFKSTSFSSINHHHLDQNEFTIFYKAPLLVDSGYYDSYGTTQWHNYFTRTIAHNSITIFDPTEQFQRWTLDPSKCPNSLCSNDGGQKFMANPYPTLTDIQPGGTNHLDGITGYEYTPEFTYTVGNASKAYSANKLDQSNGFVRSLVFLRAPAFWSKPVTIVFDKVTSTPQKAGLVKRFLLHTATEPEPLTAPGITTVSGDTLTIRNGAGMLFSQTLLPVNPIITKIGSVDAQGNDFRYTANKCTPVPPKTQCDSISDYTLTNFPIDPTYAGQATVDADKDRGEWRVEITSPVNSQSEYFLHVLSVADNSPTLGAPPAQNLSSDNAAVALLGGSQLVAFNKGDQPASMLSWNMSTTDVKMIVAGLQSGASYSGSILANGIGINPYTVTLTQDPAGQFIASSQGVVTINSPLPITLGADLSVTTTFTPSSAVVGVPLKATITVVNNGPGDASDVVLWDYLWSSFDSWILLSSQGTCTGDVGGFITCSFGTIPKGASASLEVTLIPNSVGVLTSYAWTASPADTNPNNNDSSVSINIQPPTADLSVTISDNPNPVNVNGLITYTVTVTNAGPSTANGIALSGLTGCTLPSTTLASGSNMSCTATVTASTAGTLTQTVSIVGNEFDPNMANNSASISTTVNPVADLSVTITAPATVNQGQTVTYTVTVTNAGPSTASGITLSGLTSCTLPATALASGTNMSCTATVTASTLGTLTQPVSVTGTEIDANLANNSASTTTNVQAVLSVSKTGTGTVSSTPAGINCGATCSGSYDANTVVTLTATPDATTDFGGWAGCDTVTGTNCTISMIASKTVAASFTTKSTDLSVSITAPASVTQGQTITYIVSVTNSGPSVASNVATGGTLPSCALGALANGASASCTRTATASTLGTLTQTVTVTGNESDPNLANNTQSVSSTVNPVIYTLTLSTAGTGSGSVGGAGTYNDGTSVPVTAIASTGSTFAGWSGSDGTACATGTVLMNANKSCTATFTLNTYTLSLSKAGTGSGTVSGAGTYNYGTNATVTATPNTGSTFAGWSGTNATECATGTVLMNANKSCTATFNVPDLVISAVSGPTTGTTGRSITVNVTTANTGTATAVASSTVIYLSTDGTITTADTSLGTISIGSLAAGASSPNSPTVTLPTGLVTGTYYLGAIADATGVVTEGNTTGTGESNNAKTGNSIQISGVPVAPSNLTATVNSKSKITLNWTDNATDESSFLIERSTNGTTFSQIASVGANVVTYANTGLTTSTTYYYRVRATNTRGNSTYSNTVSAKTN